MTGASTLRGTYALEGPQRAHDLTGEDGPSERQGQSSVTTRGSWARGKSGGRIEMGCSSTPCRRGSRCPLVPRKAGSQAMRVGSRKRVLPEQTGAWHLQGRRSEVMIWCWFGMHPPCLKCQHPLPLLTSTVSWNPCSPGRPFALCRVALGACAETQMVQLGKWRNGASGP